ncbi:acyl-CoA thioester hydrolase/BAAT C-terminal domain-containing protein [Hymenobacter sp. IS2118]|uniref:acyl-CoA thioester hydrolase/BAAT C-terminal domain-containing protein n=1 Tax=Hymenobacter sp. IS2118 TaxID=1505605 RepID=UPI0005595F22|nr:acyl-CoA thioester hydrolase/BAAT C-terminal domain-containing protein [Hymenobacter sp. IS2118]
MKYIGILLLGLCLDFSSAAQVLLHTPNTESKLYLGSGRQQPLVVGLGGSEGGNAWASDHWASTRNQLLAQGYAFLAIGYFGAPGTPDTLNKIAVEAVYNAIRAAAQNPAVAAGRIAIIGGSRGGDLALLLGSYYPDIDCVVALVPSHAVFPGHTAHFSTSLWTYQGRELPFVPVNDAAVPFLMKRDLRGAFTAMLADTVAGNSAAIPVEQIKAPVLLLSATADEIAPTTPMCVKIMARLKRHHFPYAYEHHAIAGGHAEPLKHFDLVFAFLKKNFPPN